MAVGPTTVAEASSAAETSSHNRLGSNNEHISAYEPGDASNTDAIGSK